MDSLDVDQAKFPISYYFLTYLILLTKTIYFGINFFGIQSSVWYDVLKKIINWTEVGKFIQNCSGIWSSG